MVTHYKQVIKYNLNLEEHKWYLDLTPITMILLSFFEETEVIREVKTIYPPKRGGKIKQMIIYVFNPKLDNSIGFAHHIPRITTPTKAESSECIKSWISPVKKGRFRVIASEKAIETLNIVQKKEFRINTKFLSLLQEADLDKKRANS